MATKIDEYVPSEIPRMSVRTNQLILSVPRKKRANNMMSVEIEV